MAAGESFCLLLTISGRVYSWGSNSFFQLGQNDAADRAEPTLIAWYTEAGGQKRDAASSFIVDIAAGDFHALALSSANKLFAWGKAQAKCGIAVKNRFNEVVGYQNITGVPEKAPKIVFEGSSDDAIREISASEHNAFVTSQGKLYVWGCNEQGQLGLVIDQGADSLLQLTEPVRIEYNIKFLSVSCGSTHTIARGEQTLGSQKKRVLLAWGDNRCGQLGPQGKTRQPFPRVVDAFGGQEVAAARAGRNCSYVITDSGAVYVMGALSSFGEDSAPLKEGQTASKTDADSSPCSQPPIRISPLPDSPSETVADIVTGYKCVAFLTRAKLPEAMLSEKILQDALL